MYRFTAHGGILNSNSIAIFFKNAFTSMTWFFSGGVVSSFVNDMQRYITDQQISTIYDVFASSGPLNKFIGFVTILGIFMVAIRVALVISQSYNINIEGQRSVPAEEYVKRIVMALVTLSLGPALIVNGFILVTVLASSLITGADGETYSLMELSQEPNVSLYVDVKTYCYQGQISAYGDSVGYKSASYANANSDKFSVLGTSDQIGTEGSYPTSAVTSELKKDDVDKLNQAFCLGYKVTKDSSVKGNLPGWNTSADGADGYQYTLRTTGVSKTVFPRKVLESLSFDISSASALKSTFGNSKNYKEVYEAVYGSSTSLDASMSSTTQAVGGLLLLVMQLALMFSFFKDLFERIIDIFGAIFSLWLYAPAYVSAQKNNMIGEMFKKVGSIYLTHMYAIVLLDLWISMVRGAPGSGVMGSIFFQTGITYGIMQALKKGNTSMQQFFDKSSSGDIISGGSKTMSEMAKSAASGK